MSLAEKDESEFCVKSENQTNAVVFTINLGFFFLTCPPSHGLDKSTPCDLCFLNWLAVAQVRSLNVYFL